MAEQKTVVHEGYIDRAKVDEFFGKHFRPASGERIGGTGGLGPLQPASCESCPAEFAGYKFHHCTVAVHQDGTSELSCYYVKK